MQVTAYRICFLGKNEKVHHYCHQVKHILKQKQNKRGERNETDSY